MQTEFGRLVRDSQEQRRAFVGFRRTYRCKESVNVSTREQPNVAKGLRISIPRPMPLSVLERFSTDITEAPAETLDCDGTSDQ